MSQLFIRDLIVEAKHGVHPHEKVTSQRFSINIELNVNTPNAFTSDNFEDTVDYSHMRKDIIETVEQTSFNLIERLAQEIANRILVDKRIKSATISIEKMDVYPSGIPGIRKTFDNN